MNLFFCFLFRMADFYWFIFKYTNSYLFRVALNLPSKSFNLFHLSGLKFSFYNIVVIVCYMFICFLGCGPTRYRKNRCGCSNYIQHLPQFPRAEDSDCYSFQSGKKKGTCLYMCAHVCTCLCEVDVHVWNRRCMEAQCRFLHIR